MFLRFLLKQRFDWMNKFIEENSLMTQDWVMEPKKKVQDIIKELMKIR